VIHRDPRCVFVANTMANAVVTATWLSQNGIPARVMDLMTLGGLEGLTALAPGISARGLEVWVNDPADAPEADRLLAEHEAALTQQAAEAEQRQPTQVVCEDCGKSSLFPADQYGTTQDCPHCGAYLDVVEPGSLSDEPDEGEEADPEDT
jgi:hypothetical protein